MIEHVTASQVEKGFYYEKKNRPGWLRLITYKRGDECRYVDFAGTGQCDAGTISRWAIRGYTAIEAAAKFPEQCAKIEAAIQRSS